MLATPPFGASSNKALLRANIKPPVELVVADLAYTEYRRTGWKCIFPKDTPHIDWQRARGVFAG